MPTARYIEFRPHTFTRLRMKTQSNDDFSSSDDENSEINAELTSKLMRLENERGVLGKTLRKDLTRQLKSMGPAKEMQKVLRKGMRIRRGTSTMFLVIFF